MRYTRDQFERATQELRACMQSAGLSPLDITEVLVEGELVPRGYSRTPTRSKNSIMMLEVQLQDDGFEPYAVIDFHRVHRPVVAGKRKSTWHSAAFKVGYEMLYPHQFKHLPKIAAALRKNTNRLAVDIK